jgi:hypothetical protein
MIRKWRGRGGGLRERAMLVGRSDAGVCCIAVFLGGGDSDENTWEFVCRDGDTDCGGNYGGTASDGSSG